MAALPQCSMLKHNTNNAKLILEGIIHPLRVKQHGKRLRGWILKGRDPQSSEEANNRLDSERKRSTVKWCCTRADKCSILMVIINWWCCAASSSAALVSASVIEISSESIAQVFVKAKTNINVTRITCSKSTGENFKDHYLGTVIRAVLYQLANGCWTEPLKCIQEQ